MFKLPTFKPGRQGSGYETMTLAFVALPNWLHTLTRIIGYDAYLIRYPTGSNIPPHVDAVPEGVTHHRVNIVLKQPREGGEFICPGATRFLNRLFYFRPDVMRHEVTTCRGTRLVLSFGFIRSRSKP